MAYFTLSSPNQIRGDQLADEILVATGVDLGTGIMQHIIFYEPLTVEIPDGLIAGLEAEIQAVVTAHVPDPLYFQWDRDEAGAKTKWQELKDQWQGELDYLEATILAIDTMDAAQVRAVVKRLAQENLRILRAFALLFRHFS
jgi:hypothetical protein